MTYSDLAFPMNAVVALNWCVVRAVFGDATSAA